MLLEKKLDQFIIKICKLFKTWNLCFHRNSVVNIGAQHIQPICMEEKVRVST